MHYLDKVRECARAHREHNTSDEFLRNAENETQKEKYLGWRSAARQKVVDTFYDALNHCPLQNLQNAAQVLDIEYLSLSNAKRAIYAALNNSADNLRVMKDVARALGVDISD